MCSHRPRLCASCIQRNCRPRHRPYLRHDLGVGLNASTPLFFLGSSTVSYNRFIAVSLSLFSISSYPTDLNAQGVLFRSIDPLRVRRGIAIACESRGSHTLGYYLTYYTLRRRACLAILSISTYWSLLPALVTLVALLLIVFVLDTNFQ